MGFRRGLVSMARVAALIALVLGTVFAFQGISRDGLSFLANPARAQDSLSNVFYLPVIFHTDPGGRDDLFSAESNLAVQTVSAGYGHACAVRLDGSLICWGLNDKGQAAPPPGTFEQVAAGASHTCGLRPGGALACWGDNTYGQSTPPVGSYIQVSAGGYHTCAIRADGTLDCWGWNAFQQLTDIPAGVFTQVAAGNLHTCALGANGAISCWGWNESGQTGAPAGVYTQVSAGSAHSCATAADGAVTCWGVNSSGELNAPPGSYSAVGAGGFHSCALRDDGAITCWGSNGFGQLNDIPQGAFRQISVGGQHTCAVRAVGSTLACWGWNRYGQSFPPSGVLVSAGRGHACAVRVDGSLSCWGENESGQAEPPAGTYTRVSAADRYTCAVRSDGTLACWGRDTGGVLMPPAGTTPFVDVSAGDDHACALDLSGTAICWGSAADGKTSPPAGLYSMISAGANHACGLRLDGTIACWGSNSAGQSSAPAGTFTQVSAGGEHTCARNALGAVTCWGSNALGQSEAEPGTFATVSAGYYHTCGIRADGPTHCWGANASGEANAPEGIFSQISAGVGFTCGVRLDGSLVCWGDPDIAPSIVVLPETLPGGEVGMPYAAQLTASGGTLPHVFSVVDGTLPLGLALSKDGLLSGTPEQEGEAAFTISAADSGEPRFSGQRAYTLAVLPPQGKDDTPPVIEAQVDGPLGMNGWYVGPVSVTWRVYDPESAVAATAGCEPTTLSADTTGVTLTCAAESAGGQSSASVTVKIDATPPEDVRGKPIVKDLKEWYNSPLTIQFFGTDKTSGIETCTTITYSGPDSAAAQVTGTCTDRAGNVSAPAVFTFQYDATAPVLDPRVDPNPVYLHGEAAAYPNASDALSGVVDARCGVVDTSQVGRFSVTCSAYDAAGNLAEASAYYNVIYRFEGFFPPVENPPAINRATAGQTIPIKFALYDANYAPVANLETFILSYQVIDCSPGLFSLEMEALYDGEEGLMYQGEGRYHYNWKTKDTFAGTCKAVSIDLGEGGGFEHVFLVHFHK